MKQPSRARKAPRRINNPEDTRRDIIDTATREFAEKGYSGARVDEIAAAAERAGVPLGGFGADERFRYSVLSSDVALLQEALARA